jgi:hypothetical protein
MVVNYERVWLCVCVEGCNNNKEKTKKAKRRTRCRDREGRAAVVKGVSESGEVVDSAGREETTGRNKIRCLAAEMTSSGIGLEERD